ncbi:hypothetical protein DUNSADRAFT_18394 [Dunaliella salina]|uniref:Uncharacterized protein n=1 Tax=Dunaliella salina TaxID=3046 RepID=A0ABQ7GZ20_DUNSA|nr:hypothetical protein DUNSADRAFT_18394 [Dunaliella salina]|eukprot:KAF5839851.1 hypothetical protein DUNSADRAFT_18394 [Dunaliella salina]
MLQKPIIASSSSARPQALRTSAPSSSSSRLVYARAACLGASTSHQGFTAGQKVSQPALPTRPSSSGPRRGAVTMMGNKGSGGIFAPIVVATRNVVGEKDFNQIRGKAISLHSQVIKEFCSQFGVESKQVQGLIRLAKKNGEWLGFLA